MRKLMRWFGVALVVLVIGGACLRFGAMYLLTGHFLAPDYREIALEGQPMVQAIYEFKLQTGLWPHSLDELVPEFLPEKPRGHWRFTYPSLCRDGVMPHTGILYTFCAPDIGWSSDGDFGRGPISLPRPAAIRPAPSREGLFENAMALLDRRIRLNPTDFELYRDKVRYLVQQERQDDAMSAAQIASNEFPEDWWPPMAQAELEQGAFPTRSATAFADWVDRHPNFNNYWYLFEYYRQHRQPDLALRALEQGSVHTVVRNRDYDTYVPDYFYFVAAAHACKLQEADLTLQLCAKWEQMSADRGYGGGDDELALRAGAYLNLGRIAEAQDCVRQAIEQQSRRAIWARDLERLNAAAQAGDVEFVYDAEKGGSVYAPLKIFESWDEDE